MSYLEKCVTSIINQSYSNLEIILVDDGATDGSGEICNQFGKLDSRIKVIHKENGGLSSARNAGLDIASGRYIAFVDSDDFIHVKMYENMIYLAQKEDADIVACKFQMVEENEDPRNIDEINTFINTEYDIVTGKDIYSQLWLRDNETVIQWNKLYKKELFIECRYPLGKYHEDVYVIHRLLEKCKRVVYVGDKLYYYVQRQTSIMHAESCRGIQDAVEGYEDRIQFFKERELHYEYERTLRMLFDYFTWKYDQIKTQYSKTDLKWFVKYYQEKYFKYSKEIKCTNEEKILYRFPLCYDYYMIWTNLWNRLCYRFKKK